MESRYDFQTKQIMRQRDQVMAAHSAWVMRSQTIKTSYQAKHISYEQYQEKMKESRREMFRQEKVACLNYKIAMWTFDRDMIVNHPETFVAPEE